MATALSWLVVCALGLASIAEEGPAGWRFPFGATDGWSYSVTRGYGDRAAGAPRYHAGVDIAAPCGTPVVAVGPGEIVRVRRAEGLGLVLRLDDREGHGVPPVYALYGHLLSLQQAGGEVRAGEVIALSGRAGRGAGCHLHFALRRGEEPDRGYTLEPPAAAGYLDPRPWLEARTRPP